MFEIKINGKKVVVESSLTVLQACKTAGIEIPRFCYHEKLSIAGNCRMCLVELKGSMKPIASCAMPLSNGMDIYTDTLSVRKAREGVMEYLLSNHPLDCPICDQGGECDLQDQAMLYGNDRGRFYEVKRAVEDKNCGPLIKTVMTRCIHCTRCVRFSTEVAGMADLGITGRGNNMEIGTYVNNMLKSEISGNIIDLCPVGALTSKPYAFTARPWELKSVEGIDLHDSMGSNIRLGVRGLDLMRVLPLTNEEINDEWLTDKARFGYDGYKLQRLHNPLIKTKENKLESVTWEVAFKEILKNLYKKNYHLEMVVGNNMDLEAMSVAKDFCSNYGSYSIRTEMDFENLNIDTKENYNFNSTFDGIKETDFCMLIGSNVRLEMPLLAARIRKEVNKRNLSVVSVGNVMETYFKVKHLGNSTNTLIKILEGRHPICGELRKAKKPMLIINTYSLQLLGINGWKKALKSLSNYTNIVNADWNGINYMQMGGNQVGAYDLGIGAEPKKIYKNKVLYLLGVNSLDIKKSEYDYIIYQGDHGNSLVESADVVLAGCSLLEKEGIYTNIEGRPQTSKFVFYPKGDARNDWRILRSLNEYLFRFSNLKINSLKDVRDRIEQISPVYLNSVSLKTVKCNELLGKNKLNKVIFNNYIKDYYRTDNVTKASKVMALCSNKVKKYKSNFKWK